MALEEGRASLRELSLGMQEKFIKVNLEKSYYELKSMKPFSSLSQVSLGRLQLEHTGLNSVKNTS